MARGSTFRGIFLATIGAVLVVASWLLFAPPIVGGSTGYAIVTGSSMAPEVQPNDLVVLRAQPSYSLGDVVAYRSASLGTIVLHRIIGVRGDRFVMEGDNNSWKDPDHPSTENVIGTMWLRIPALGGALRRPWFVFALVAGLLLAGIGLGAAGRRRRPAVTSTRGRHIKPAANSPGSTVLVLFTAAALAFATLGVAAFATAATRAGTSKIVYRSAGSFEYGATAQRGPVYPRGRLTTDDPVFLQLVKSVHVSFVFRFESSAPHTVCGTAQLFSTVSDVNGWTHTIALGPPNPYNGDVSVVRGRIDLPAIRALVDRVQKLTGVVSDHYELDLVPRVELSGTVAGTGLHDTFSPHLPFQLDSLQLQRTGTPSATGGAPADPLHPAVNGSVAARRSSPATFSAYRWSLDVIAARWLAAVGTLACLIGLAVVRAWGRRVDSWEEPRRIESRYGPLLVPVRESTLATTSPVEVTRIETLVRLAEHYDRLILHGESGETHDYVVEHGGLGYLYRIAAGQQAVDTRPSHPSPESSGNGARSAPAGPPR